jgi:UDP-N-acetylmuramoyl-tripeptide--D-alanyl-D-alanine ligase
MTVMTAAGWSLQRDPRARLVGDGATPLARVHTDTRTLQPGDLFVALKGERLTPDFLPRRAPRRRRHATRPAGRGPAGIEVPDSCWRWAHWLPAGARSSICR